MDPFVIVMSSDFETSRSVLKAGADAFVSKVDEPNWLLEKLHPYAIQGNSCMCKSLKFL
jgi:DNA-binding NarL/FixJ family response regulator